MVFHKEPRLPIDIDQSPDQMTDNSSPDTHDEDIITRYAKKMLQIQAEIAELAPQNIKKAQARQKKNFDKRHSPPSFEVGANILLKNVARQGRQGGKMDSHFTGPYTIDEDLGHGVYRLKSRKTGKVLAKTYNSIRFKSYHEDSDSTSLSHDSPAPAPPKDSTPSTLTATPPSLFTNVWKQESWHLSHLQRKGAAPHQPDAYYRILYNNFSVYMYIIVFILLSS